MSVTVKQFVTVVPLTFTGTTSKGFTYEYAGEPTLQPGQVVRVPLGRRQSLGVVTQTVAPPEFATKTVTDVLDIKPLPTHLVKLAEWMSEYYFSSSKAVWQTLLPAGIQRKRRALKARKKSFQLPPQTQVLTDQQQAAYDSIMATTKTPEQPTTFLVQGVTGSGKTRLYLELAGAHLHQNQSVIVLVPEIALSPQLIALFEASFPGRVLAYHSGLTEAEKHTAWQKALDSSEPLVIVGPRSSLFLPVQNPGIIIIDECHETSYKQEQNPRYHAIMVAAKLARLCGAKLVLGSATPALTEVYAAQAGRITLLKLTERVQGRPLPTATIIDMKDLALRGKHPLLSVPLLTAIGETLTAGRQSLLFINRRGTASSQICNDCGFVATCPICHLPLTFHSDLLQQVCHLCGYRQTPVAICPECHHSDLRFIGGGTKRVEAEITKLFPDARVARLDKDSAGTTSLPELYNQLHGGTVDILIGTQMIAKGLDLPMLHTVGVINADSMLHMPDFSSAERTFQLLAQVAGRAGRGHTPGQVFVQTRTPNHPAIVAASRSDFWTFAEQELTSRQLLGYPPYRFLLKLTYSNKDEHTAIRTSQSLYDKLKQNPAVKVLGPAPAFHERAGGSFHWQIVVKAARRSVLVDIARSVPDSWKTDLDPVNVL